MTRSTSYRLLDMLAEIPDPRKQKGKRHPLKAILALTVIAMMCGCRGYTAIAEYGRTYEQLRETLGFRHPKTPCPATFHNVFRDLDIQALQTKLTQWITFTLQGFETHQGGLTARTRPPARGIPLWFETHQGGLTAVAIDGKTLRAARNKMPNSHTLCQW